MFQTPFSDRIRNEAGIATMAVGNIYEADHVNSILMAGRADLVCLARAASRQPLLDAARRRRRWATRSASGRCPTSPGATSLATGRTRGEGWT
jgi:anthraniloyl-CoA monooxygenase